MARKRPLIRGQGADVFFTETAQQDEAATQLTPTGAAGKRVMATFYLPPALVDTLDRVWVERRMNDRKAQKSHIVAEALEAYLQSSSRAL